MTYGIVFSGGGALGSWEVGCYDAITARHGGQAPIVATGASAGALNAAGVCASINAVDLAALWASITPNDVCRSKMGVWELTKVAAQAITLGPSKAVSKFLRRHISWFDTAPLKQTLHAKLEGRFTQFSQSPIHFAMSVTNLTHKQREYFYKVPVGAELPRRATARQDVRWTRVASLDMLVDGLVGSTALPVLFPPHGPYFDGGVLQNQPITPALQLFEQGAEPDILYVAIPSSARLGRTDNLINISQTLISTWIEMSLDAQIGRLRLVNDMRGFRREHGEKDAKKIPVCVIRPENDLTERYDVGLLSFGLRVADLVGDGRNSANNRLNTFDPSKEATWY